jgi:NitT/TauT family transport system substrate-binding protein
MKNREDTMLRALVIVVILSAAAPASAQEPLKAAVSQRGQWDTAVTELGVRSGIFKKHGIDIELLYTQGGPESQQAVISGSMDVACGGGIEAVIGAYGRGAPLRIIGSEMIGSPDTYWFVPANSPIKSLQDAAGKTVSYSQTGSSSHTLLLALLAQYKVDAKPVATGAHPATLTMVMSGQIDIGRGAAPFGLDLVEQGRIRVIARGTEVASRANQTVRICISNQQTLDKRRDVISRFMQGYRDTLDWMYSDPAALKIFEEFSGVPQTLMVRARDEYFPKPTMWPDEVKGIDLTMADAVKNKFLGAPLTPEQVRELIQVPPPRK